MIRFKLAASFLLLGNFLASPVAIGQEPTKEGRPAAKPAGQVDPAAQGDPKGETKSEQLVAELDQLIAQQQPVHLRSLQAAAGAKSFDAFTNTFGLSLSDADDALRSQLEIPPGQGVVVVGVKGGSLAEHAGLKLNDVLLALGDQPAKSWGQVKQILLALGTEPVEVKLIREGKPSRMSLVGPKHGFPPEAAEFWIGTPVSPVDATLRAHLSTLPADSGLIVNDVVKDSPADQASVKTNDILASMNGKPLKNSDALIAQIQASQGKPVPLQILRAGKMLTLTIRPAKRAHPPVINLKNYPQVTYQVVRPNMAIEVAPRAPQALVVDTVPGQDKLVESKPSMSGNYTLFAPYTGVVHNPYLDLNSTAPTAIPNFPTWVYTNNINPDPSTARIEAQLKEVVTKLDDITKILEALKKSAGK
jgi:membrane-associated protease RseP (regulator of RpoE activity)